MEGSGLFSYGLDDVPGGNSPWPILMPRSDIIEMKRAEDLTGLCYKTIKRYCEKFGIGVHTFESGPWRISAPALIMVVHSDLVALELFRQGKRDHPRVSRYLDHLGLPV